MEKSRSPKLHSALLIVLALLILLIIFIRWQQPTSPLYLVEVPEGETGSAVCYEKGMSCVSLTTARIIDADKKFYGFSTPSCDSQVIRESSCIDSHGTEFAIDNVVYTKSPNAESDQYFSTSYFCVSEGKGPQGVYEYAYCAKR